MGVVRIDRHASAGDPEASGTPAPGPQFDHVSIAVADLDAAIAFWTERFGLRLAGRETVASRGVEVARPADGAVPGVERFLKERGPGLHHPAFRVPESGRARAGIALPPAEPCPRTGAGGRPAAYLHPRATGGTLVEPIEGGPEG